MIFHSLVWPAETSGLCRRVPVIAPHGIIEGTCMVRKDSALKEIADVDKPGIRVAVGRNSAYDLHLTRTVKNATVVRAAVGGGLAMI